MQSNWKYVILGAGCAGLSLCHYLLEQGITDSILILDQKSAFSDDRTWCFWNTRQTPFDDLATHSWESWAIVGSDGEEVRRSADGLRYLHIRGEDFYRRALETIARHPNVCLRLGEPVLGYQEDEGSVRVRTSEDEYAAEILFDSTAVPRPMSLALSPTELFTYQHFFGQIIRTEKPCFDSDHCTLMDFRCEQSRCLHFFYVLPFSPTEALVENTYIGRDRLPAECHRGEICDYLARCYGTSPAQVLHEESGCIPMTTRALTHPPEDYAPPKRVFLIGTAGGCSKASTGYTFLRIQDQCRRLASALTHPDARAANANARAANANARAANANARKYAFFDVVFLTALLREPKRFPSVFYRLFQRVPPAALVRFLSEESNWTEDLRVISALCPVAAPFLSAAIRSAPHWLAALRR